MPNLLRESALLNWKFQRCGGFKSQNISWSQPLFKRNLNLITSLCDWFFMNSVILLGAIVNTIMQAQIFSLSEHWADWVNFQTEKLSNDMVLYSFNFFPFLWKRSQNVEQSSWLMYCNIYFSLWWNDNHTVNEHQMYLLSCWLKW